jgi:RNA polymerase sigma factor (TIGR02999 family)
MQGHSSEDPELPRADSASSGRSLDLRELSDTIYADMRRIGGGMMKDERAGHTLTPTALANAAVERLLETGQVRFHDKAHLRAAAALAMRRELIEHARARGRVKRGGARSRISWDDVAHLIASRDDTDFLFALEDAILRITHDDPRHGQILQMRVFGEMQFADIAKVLSVSLSTVEKDWKYIRRRAGDLLGIVESSVPGADRPQPS